MEKKNFVSLISGTVGGILFAIGMCMTLLPEWDVFNEGIGVACAGIVVLLAMLIVRRKMEGKPAIRLNPKVIATFTFGIAGALALGVGMCMVMLWEDMIVAGIVVGVVGILISICSIPVYKKLELVEGGQ
ncbi:hypothetical protein [Planomicrobium sp. CPCC 101110]|uniref:hypothetical protein n=1 Tax=Planomicrobium sp. CPCC 101110 TaxID=2599619 RepID=UPI0011B35D94|nr:hypothetical protein [Planomicrobium sp. CPCC 101110]TWT25753.1 hypothetical protein FQV30_08080 [Planomicrobium sp. CPCC 101110]